MNFLLSIGTATCNFVECVNLMCSATPFPSYPTKPTISFSANVSQYEGILTAKYQGRSGYVCKQNI